MFTQGFEKTAGFFDAAAKVFSKNTGQLGRIGTNVASTAKPALKPLQNSGAVLAKRVDGSAVTTNWGLKQGVRSGSVRYADIA